MLRGLSAGRLRSRLVLPVLLALLPVVAASTLANLQQRSAALERFVDDARQTTAPVAADLIASSIILCRSQDPEPFVGTRVSADVLERIRDSDRTGAETSGFDGVARRYVTAGLGRPTARSTMLLAVGYPTADTLRPFNRILATQSMFVGLGVLVAMLAVSRAARRLVLGPAEALVSAITRVRAGDLTARVAPAGGAELRELWASRPRTASSGRAAGS